MKILKYIVGFAALALFFALIDPSGIGFKNHITAVKKWASGEAKKLRFESALKDR